MKNLKFRLILVTFIFSLWFCVFPIRFSFGQDSAEIDRIKNHIFKNNYQGMPEISIEQALASSTQIVDSIWQLVQQNETVFVELTCECNWQKVSSLVLQDLEVWPELHQKMENAIPMIEKFWIIMRFEVLPDQLFHPIGGFLKFETTDGSSGISRAISSENTLQGIYMEHPLFNGSTLLEAMKESGEN
ncbi:MAG: hypothetical protein ACOYXC_03160 [Candidatus Rifleibacteriota bacterium]